MPDLYDLLNEIKIQVKSYINKDDIKNHDNLIELGITSVNVMGIISKLRRHNINVSFSKLMEKPCFAEWEVAIKNARKLNNPNNSNKKVIGNKLFELTDIQYAYLVGGHDNQIQGGVGCHAYIEIDGKEIDCKRLNDAWNKLQYRHPMLRARFTEDGKQEILEKPFSEEIEVFDLSNLDAEENKIRLDEIRENLSHRKLRVEMGEVAGLKLANLSQNRNKIFFDLDLLVADVMSLSLILKELGELYLGKELDNLNNYTFKDYINNLEVDSEIYKKDQEFWKEKIDSFEIERPNLPLKKAPEQIKETRFTEENELLKKINGAK